MEVALTALVWIVAVAFVAVFVVWAVAVIYMGIQAKKINEKAQKEFDELWGNFKGDKRTFEEIWGEHYEKDDVKYWGGKK